MDPALTSGNRKARLGDMLSYLNPLIGVSVATVSAICGFACRSVLPRTKFCPAIITRKDICLEPSTAVMIMVNAAMFLAVVLHLGKLNPRQLNQASCLPVTLPSKNDELSQ